MAHFPLLRRLAVALGVKPGMVQSYPFMDAARRRAREGYPELESVFRAAEPQFLKVLSAIDSYAEDFGRFSGVAPEPRFDQDWFPPVDGAAAYALTRTAEPKRIIEIGGGHSTRFFQRALKDGSIACAHIVVDPGEKARRKTEGLSVRRIESALEDVSLDALGKFSANDILSLDGSHMAIPGGDCDGAINRLLPKLPAGALVHIHDIFLPDAYPEIWEERPYNEQSLIAALLQGGGYEPVFSSHYVATRMGGGAAKTALARLPRSEKALDSSLWLRKSGKFS